MIYRGQEEEAPSVEEIFEHPEEVVLDDGEGEEAGDETSDETPADEGATEKDAE